MKTLLLLVLLALPAESFAQQPLSEVAKAAREAVLRGDLGSLVSRSRGLKLRLPGAEPSSALGPAHATATLRDHFRRGETAEVTVEDFREVGGGLAFVELRREYRVPGSPERRSQLILLSYRQTRGAGWQLVEVRAN
ncbi:MAG TPA: hypothetical protein VGA78_11420 [Gemmatimonadales bacterium]